MTVAEMVVLAVVLVLLVWLLRPLQHWVRDGLERLFLRGRYGKVIEGKFRSVKKEEEKPPGADQPNGDRP
jgi:hypothetical protein